tara:strand:+ start:404 stop:751 length:348 start_codon:yes stop_codon:yes gene_type:complete
MAILSQVTFSPFAVAESKLHDLMLKQMTVAKLAGACGVYKQMADFQEYSKMDNSDKFVFAFMQSEASRLDNTPEKFLESCNSMMLIYKSAIDSINENKNANSGLIAPNTQRNPEE